MIELHHVPHPSTELERSGNLSGLCEDNPYASRRAASLSLYRQLTYQPHNLASRASAGELLGRLFIRQPGCF